MEHVSMELNVAGKKERQDAIRKLISEETIQTQGEMVEALQRLGLQVTQGTVSRDIREMRLVKAMTPDGVYCYSPPKRTAPGGTSRFSRMMAETVVSVECAQNLVVIKTLAGSANMVAEALDSSSWREIVGTLAGDNTIFMATHTAEEAQNMCARIRELVK